GTLAICDRLAKRDQIFPEADFVDRRDELRFLSDDALSIDLSGERDAGRAHGPGDAGIAFGTHCSDRTGQTHRAWNALRSSTPTLAAIARSLKVEAGKLLGLDGSSRYRPAAREARMAYGTSQLPELRRLQRRLRHAQPSTIRLLILVAAALERRDEHPRTRI